MSYAFTNRLLFDTMFKGVVGNTFQPDAVPYMMPAELQPAGYNLQLTVDGMLMGFLTADVSAASPSSPTTANYNLWNHVKALGVMTDPSAYASGIVYRDDGAVISRW